MHPGLAGQAVIALCLTQDVAAVGNDTLPILHPLGKDRPDPHVAGIAVQDKGPLGVWVGQDWGPWWGPPGAWQRLSGRHHPSHTDGVSVQRVTVLTCDDQHNASIVVVLMAVFGKRVKVLVNAFFFL